ncbi:XRE family transcriptional regulator [Burkholderia stagnalis]|uniref:XRE family transcriptional regulator n=1 Tax=Burkholderia stagnalis TaxID=1503054 RepID=UPI000AD17E2C|nr:XRE family transcriptional regulator [Burkholderia stagnalis]
MSELPGKYRFPRHESKEIRDDVGLDFLYPPRMEIKTWIRDARKRAGLTQEQLGDRLGLTKGNVSAWENGRHEPSYAQIQAIASITGQPVPSGPGRAQPLLISGEGRQRTQEMLAETGLDASAFAARAGVPEKHVLAWLEDGGPITIEDAAAVQKEFGFNSAWVFAGVGEKLASALHDYEFRPRPLGKRKALAVVGMAQLGDNGYWADIEFAVGHGDGYIDWPTSDPDAYALRCEGESMKPRIKNGEYVIVEPNHSVQPGDEVLVKAKDGRVMVKEFAYQASGAFTFLSVNEAHGKITLREEQVEKIHYVAGIAKRSMWRPD